MLKSYGILCLLWVLTHILLRAIFFFYRSSSHRHLRLPPSPFGLPILGHLHLMTPIPHQALHKLSLRYGPLMSIRLGSVPCVVASTAETAREFLKTHELSFADRSDSKAVAYLTYGSKDFSFAPYGPYWRFMKKLCMSELLGGRTLDQLHPLRREEIVSTLRTFSAMSVEGRAVDVGRELMKTTNNVICRMLMSRRCSEGEEEAEAARRIVTETVEITGRFNFADYIGFCKNLDLQGFNRRLEEVHRRFDGMTERILREKEEERSSSFGKSKVKDLLDIMLDISEDVTAEMKLTRENIKAFILDIFAAGTDTSAVTIEWALAELINNPTILRKARDEIDMVVGKDRLVEESDIPNLPYLQAIVKETLRIHPTGPMIPRESTEDCKIMGYDIPAGTRLFVNVWALGRDPNYWKEPLVFRPERFIMTSTTEKGTATDFRGQHFHFLPFGTGRRMCVGASLALQIIQPMLATMIQCFDFEVGGDGTVDMEEAPGLTLPRAHPLKCKMVARFHPLPVA